MKIGCHCKRRLVPVQEVCAEKQLGLVYEGLKCQHECLGVQLRD